MKYTIKDVAREAGVSISTVSRVLNGKDRVKKDTKEKIEAIIEKMQFQPDQIARTMIMKETKTVGLIVPQMSNEYWSLVAGAVQERLWDMGYSLLISSIEKNPEREEMILKSLLERRVDGVIYGTSALLDEKGQAWLDNHPLMAKNIPSVALDAKMAGGFYCVVGDHLQGARQAAQHLIDLGHSSIAYIGGPSVSNERELGYRIALMSNGLETNDALIKLGFSYTINFTQFGYDSTIDLLNSHESFTAIFCGNDLIAIGAIKALEEANKTVPDHVAVVGYDNINFASFVKPALTTVHQPITEMGNAAVDLLLDLIQKGDAYGSRNKIVFEMKMIIRESCGASQKSLIKT